MNIQFYDVFQVVTATLSIIPLVQVAIRKQWHSKILLLVALYWFSNGLVSCFVYVFVYHFNGIFAHEWYSRIMPMTNFIDCSLVTAIAGVVTYRRLWKKVFRYAWSAFAFAAVLMMFFPVHGFAIRATFLIIVYLVGIVSMSICIYGLYQYNQYNTRIVATIYLTLSILFFYLAGVPVTLFQLFHVLADFTSLGVRMAINILSEISELIAMIITIVTLYVYKAKETRMSYSSL